jgi:hypothetical protein
VLESVLFHAFHDCLLPVCLPCQAPVETVLDRLDGGGLNGAG